MREKKLGRVEYEAVHATKGRGDVKCLLHRELKDGLETQARKVDVDDTEAPAQLGTLKTST